MTKTFVLFVHVLSDPPRWFGWKSYWTEEAALNAFRDLLRSNFCMGEFELDNVAKIEGGGMTSWVKVEPKDPKKIVLNPGGTIGMNGDISGMQLTLRQY